MRTIIIAIWTLLLPAAAAFAQGSNPPPGPVINQTPVIGGTANQCLYVTSAGRVGNQACGTGTATDIKVGTTTISSGTTTRILYDNAGTLGEYTLAGTGTVVAMQTSPVFLTNITTPAIISGSGDVTVTPANFRTTLVGAAYTSKVDVVRLQSSGVSSAGGGGNIIFESGSATLGRIGEVFDGTTISMIVQDLYSGSVRTGVAFEVIGSATTTNHITVTPGTNPTLAVSGGSLAVTPATVFASTISATLANTATTSAVCYNTGTGLFSYNSTIGTCTVSALRYKDPGKPIAEHDALVSLNGLRTESWSYKKDSPGLDNRVRVGLYADDVARMDARCAVYDEKGAVENYDDRCVLAYLVGAVKDLASRGDIRKAAK